jgi:uncharacterized protein
MTARPEPRPVAVVTGASAGIGREYCWQLAARGYELIAVARTVDRLVELQAEIAARHGIAVEVFPADLTRDDDVSRLIARLDAEPRFRLLVNNAGFGTLGLLAKTDPVPQETMVRLHVLAPMRLSQAAARLLAPRGEGAIINVSSIASFLFSAGNVNYCATKAFLTNFSEGLAAELARQGVQVQALCPGFTRSEFHQRANMPTGGLPAPMWLSADEVVRASLQALDRRGPVVCVPGTWYRLLVPLLRILPRRLIGWASDRGRRGMMEPGLAG